MFDVLIIGAGVIGAAIAREASKYKLKTLVLEKNIEVGEVTTKANSAIVHAGFDCVEGSLKAKMNVKGCLMMEEVTKDLEVPYEKIGSFVIGFDEEDEKEIENLYRRGLTNGVKNLEIISGEEARKIEPNLSEKITKVLVAHDAGIVCPFNLCYAFIENAIENGVELKTETEVLSIEKKFDEENNIFYLLHTNNGDFESRVVINAAGLYSDKIANMLGEFDFTIQPRKGEYRLLDKSERKIINHVIFQTPTKMGKGVLVTPTVHGNLLIGPTSLDVKDINDFTTTKEGLNIVDTLSKKSVPNIRLNKSIRVFSGLRATPSSHDFMIYMSKINKGFINAAGIESPGLASSPAIAEYVLEILKNENILKVEEKDNFKKKRKSIPIFNKYSDEEKTRLIKENSKFGKIICRCEMISEEEIIEAIHRPAGARTVDGVKRRVRPGMGRCQGGFCGPKVVEILSRELNIPFDDVLKDSRGSKIVMSRAKGIK